MGTADSPTVPRPRKLVHKQAPTQNAPLVTAVQTSTGQTQREAGARRLPVFIFTVGPIGEDLLFHLILSKVASRRKSISSAESAATVRGSWYYFVSLQAATAEPATLFLQGYLCNSCFKWYKKKKNPTMDLSVSKQTCFPSNCNTKEKERKNKRWFTNLKVHDQVCFFFFFH